MWECPDFFPLGNKHVLLYSTEHRTCWEVGSFDKSDLRFHSEQRGLLDHGAYYAPRSMADGDGRRILWGWVQETRSREESRQAGWSGCISLPRVLTVGSDNRLQIEVAPEFASLRQNTVTIEPPRTTADLTNQLTRATIVNRAGEVICTFKAGENPCGIELQLASATGSTSFFTISYSQATGKPFVAIGDKLLPLRPDHEGYSTLHIWVDGSVIETYIDKKEVVTTRWYDQPTAEGDIRVVWNGTVDVLKQLTISGIKPISDDRLTT